LRAATTHSAGTTLFTFTRDGPPLEPASGRTNRERLALVTRRRPPDGAGARRPRRNYGKNRTPPADERSRNWSAAPARGVRETGLEALFCEQGFPPGGGCGGEPAWESPAPTQGVPLPGAASGARQGRVPPPRGVGAGAGPKVIRPIASARSSVRFSTVSSSESAVAAEVMTSTSVESAGSTSMSIALSRRIPLLSPMCRACALGVYEIHITPCSTAGALGGEGGALGGGLFSGESGGSSA